MPTSSTEEIENIIREKIKKELDIREDLKEKAGEVRDYWKSIAPIGDPAVDPHSGAYMRSIHVSKVFGRTDKGMPSIKVLTTNPLCDIIEYGSGIDRAGGEPRPQGGASPEYAPALKTAIHFSEHGGE